MKNIVLILFFIFCLQIPSYAKERKNPFAAIQTKTPEASSPAKTAMKIEDDTKLETVFIPVNYAVAKELSEHIENLISNHMGANLSVDVRSNTIIVTDTKEVIEKAKRIIKELDKATPQVLIEAKIVEVNTNFSKEIGIDWGIESMQNVGSDGVLGYDAAVNMPKASFGTFGISFNRIGSDSAKLLLNAKLFAMESEGKGKIVSSPRILTKNNREALIKQGIEYPYLKEIDEDGVSKYALKSLSLTLKVTPHITQDKKIILNISIKKDDLGNTIAGHQSFLNKEANTELLANNNDTIVIGGIFKTNETEEENKIPLLGDIPFLGVLFRSKAKVQSKEELMIFITPQIVEF